MRQNEILPVVQRAVLESQGHSFHECVSEGKAKAELVITKTTTIGTFVFDTRRWQLSLSACKAYKRHVNDHHQRHN